VQIVVYESDAALEQRDRIEAELKQARESESDDFKDNKDPLVEHRIQAI